MNDASPSVNGTTITPKIPTIPCADIAPTGSSSFSFLSKYKIEK